jgi:hypothetical protein
VPKAQWAHYRVYFDAEKGLVEYYRNDMDNPVHVDTDVPVLGRAQYMDGFLRMANFGLLNGPATYGIDNIELRKIAAEETLETELTRAAVVFQGINRGAQPLDAALGALGAKPVHRYQVVTTRSSPFPSNRFKLEKVPGRRLLQSAGLIVLDNVPLEPGKVMPEFLQKRIAEQVEQGATLLVLGGLFSLDRGGYQGSELGGILPGELPDKWASGPLLETSSLSAETDPYKGILAASKDTPAVSWLQQLELRSNAQTLMTAEGRPFLVAGSHGKGSVLLVAGMACGQAEAETVPFWQWSKWPECLAASVRRHSEVF